MTPENLPKTNEEWTLFFKILAWFTGVIFSILGIVKITVFISKNVFKVIEMIKNYEQLKIEIIKKNEEIDLRLKNLVTYEDLEKVIDGDLDEETWLNKYYDKDLD